MNDGYCRLTVFCLFACVLLAGGIVAEAGVDKNPEKQQTEQVVPGGESLPPPLKPGEWGLLFELGENLFPSMVICTATLKDDGNDDNDEFLLGEPWSAIGAKVFLFF